MIKTDCESERAGDQFT